MPGRAAKENTNNYPIALLTKRVLHLFRDVLDEKLRPWGVTAAQMHVLAKLEQEPGISGATLARTCMVTPQTTQVLLRSVEKNGWVVRKKHPENDRILLATLTPSGKRILTRSRTAIGQLYELMLHDLAEKDVHALEKMLSQCAANLESSRTGGSQAR